MKELFKSHIDSLYRAKTSIGRDLEEGLLLDRNERVAEFPDYILKDLYQNLPNHLLRVYPETESLYQLLSQYLGLEKTHIFLTFGSTGGIKVLFETISNPGDKIFSISPSFPMYEIYSKIFQTEFNAIQIQDFKVNVEKLLKDIDKNTSLVFIANPNLPVETLLNNHDIEIIAEKCKKLGSLLVIDEAYNLFGADSSINLIKDYENLVILRTFSKAFGLAGIRLGYMISQPQNIDYFSNIRSLVETNGLTIAIAEYMLKHPEIMTNYVKSVKEGSKYIKESFKTIGINFHGGNYSNGILVFLKSSKFAEFMVSELNKKKIYIRGAFNEPFDSCVRVTLGPRNIMENFFDSFKACLYEGPNL